MTDFSEINPHLALWQSETYESPREQAWLSWVKKAEKLLGHSLDGDEDVDGHSLDTANDLFDADYAVSAYCFEVLVSKYKIWCKANNLPHVDANETILDEKLTAEQRQWLTAFIQKWEEVEQAEEAEKKAADRRAANFMKAEELHTREGEF